MAKKTLKPIRLDFNNVMAEAVGKKHGLTAAEIKAFDKRAVTFHKQLLAERKSAKLGFYDLPYQDALVRRIKKTVAQLKDRFENFVVLGIGGSALGNIALQAALNHPYYNLLDKKARNGMPRIFVMDNVDPEYFGGLLDIIDPKTTLFNLISKSGGTAEPMSQFMVVREILRKKLGAKAKDHIIATTDKESGILREIVDKEDYDSFIIPDNVGGRFSVFASVGLLSAAMGGIDIAQLLAGAAAMDARCSTPSPAKNPAYRNAVVHYLADTKKGKSISVMMPYSNALYLIADWYRQLWAESLGKKFDTKKKIVNVGQTPIKALGATDQHSQVQLYAEGPNDKIFTLVGVEKYRREIKIPNAYKQYDALSYLGDKTMNQLIEAERVGTELALRTAERPTVSLVLPEIDAHTIGQTLYMYEVQTAFAGKLYNINAFDQPGVEAGKIAAFALMGHKKYAADKKRITASMKKCARNVL